jgi:hypothetical protein
MGVPVVLSSNIPDKISKESSSFLVDVTSDWPGFLRLSSVDIFLRSSSRPAGQPSRIPPIPAP